MVERRGSATPSYVRVETGRRTDFDEVLELHESRARLVVIAEDLEDLGLLEVEAEGTHCHFELVVVDAAILVCVEEFKRLFDLLLLLIGELWPRVGASLGFLDSCRPVHGVEYVCGTDTRRGGAAETLGRGSGEREGEQERVVGRRVDASAERRLFAACRPRGSAQPNYGNPGASPVSRQPGEPILSSPH